MCCDILCLFLNAGMRASTPDDIDDVLDPAPDQMDAPPSPPFPAPDAQGRQKSAAAVKSFDPSHFLAKISTPPTPATFDSIRDVRRQYAVPNGVQAPGVASDGYRTALKRKADGITRSQYEVYSFSTKNNLSEAAITELLEMLSNVCVSILNSNMFHAVIRSNK